MLPPSVTVLDFRLKILIASGFYSLQASPQALVEVSKRMANDNLDLWDLFGITVS